MPPKRNEDNGVSETEAAPTPDPVPFAHGVTPHLKPPTSAQHEWLQKNTRYRRTGHTPLGRFTFRGTLMEDGTFISEDKMPVMDGGGNFGVGIPI